MLQLLASRLCTKCYLYKVPRLGLAAAIFQVYTITYMFSLVRKQLFIMLFINGGFPKASFQFIVLIAQMTS